MLLCYCYYMVAVCKTPWDAAQSQVAERKPLRGFTNGCSCKNSKEAGLFQGCQNRQGGMVGSGAAVPEHRAGKAQDARMLDQFSKHFSREEIAILVHHLA